MNPAGMRNLKREPKSMELMATNTNHCPVEIKIYISKIPAGYKDFYCSTQSKFRARLFFLVLEPTSWRKNDVKSLEKYQSLLGGIKICSGLATPCVRQQLQLWPKKHSQTPVFKNLVANEVFKH